MKRIAYVSLVLSFVIILTACNPILTSPTTTISPLPKAPPSSSPTDEVREWDYVAMGESITMDMTDRFAKILEQDHSVLIVLHDWQIPSAHSSNLLEKLRTNEQLRQDLKEAEVITLNIPIGVIANAMKTYTFGDPGDCGGVDNQDCIQEAFSIYMTDTDEIMAEIVSLRKPSEALIRIMDTWQIKVSETQETGTFEMYNEYWRAANAHLAKTAARYNIPVVHVYDAFMGEDGREDPRDLGLIASDGLHPTKEGSELMAELFRNLGYEHAEDSP